MDARLSAALADRYELLRELGAGGMATVYLARDVRHNRQVALKVLHPELSAVLGPERFLKEIELTASLQHPHILPLFDSGEAGGQLFYVMPYVEGETLRGRLERETQLPVADAVQLAREVAGALQYAHERGVIHRDIKPENILLQGAAGDQHALVADFGIALAVQQAGGARMTQTGLSLGTPQYMAPEQAMGERTIDARADVYALGAVTYEMLAGEPPFTGPSTQAIVAKVMSTDPQPLNVLRRNVPAHVADAVHHALEKLPADRVASARTFVEALDARSTAPAIGRAPVVVARGRGPSWVAAGAIALAAAVTGAIAGARRGADRVEAPAAASPILATIALPDSLRLPLGFGRVYDLSRDGSTLVAVVRAGTRHALVRRRLDDEQVAVIPGSETDAGRPADPRISPRGQRLLYLGADGQWQLLPLGGGTPRAMPFRNGVPEWISEDSVIVETSDTLALGSVTTAQLRPLPPPVLTGTRGVRVSGIRHPALLPGGERAVVTVAHAPNRDTLDYLAVYSLRDGAVQSLGVRGYDARYLPGGYLLFTQTGEDLLAVRFSAERGAMEGEPVRIADGVLLARPQGRLALAAGDDGTLLFRRGTMGGEAVIVTGSGEERPVPGPPAMGYFPRVSPDGRAVVAQITAQWKDGFWVKDLRTGVVQRRVADSLTHHPEWGPDGRSLVFAEGAQLVQRSVDDPADRRVLATGNFGRFAVSFGADLLIRCNEGPGLSVAPLAAADSLRPLAPTPGGRCVAPTLSPDGRWLAYTLATDNEVVVYLLAISEPGRRIRVSPGRGGAPRFSPDGRTLFYRSEGHMQAARLTADGRIARIDSLFPVRTYVGAENIGRSWDLFPDGRFLMMRRNESPELLLLANWQRRLAP